MKLHIALAAAAIAAIAQTATASDATDPATGPGNRVAELCGAGHVNEVAGPGDVEANPDGFYVNSLQEQISLDDARIVFSNVEAPYLCTRMAATPDMDTTNVILNGGLRVTSWLFVPSHPMGR